MLRYKANNKAASWRTSCEPTDDVSLDFASTGDSEILASDFSFEILANSLKKSLIKYN